MLGGRGNQGSFYDTNQICARYYSPELARFISEDPLGVQAGLNFYAYVGNNPVNFTDPFGLIGLQFLQGLVVTGVIADIIANLELYFDDEMGCGNVTIKPPTLFDKGLPLPFPFGINIPIQKYNLPLLGEQWLPNNIQVISDPALGNLITNTNRVY